MSIAGALKVLLTDIRPLRESPAYRRLWIGQSLSAAGNMMTGVVVALQVYALTGSSLAVGLVGLVEAGPIVAVGLVGGSLADVIDRRRLVLVATIAMAVIAGIFSVQAAADFGQLWLLYVLAAMQAGLAALTTPATRAMLPRLLPPERLPAAAALSQMTFQASLVIGPLVAGVLVGTVGLTTAYLVDTASFGYLIYAAYRLPAMPVTGGLPVGLGAVLAGVRFVARQPILSTVLALDLNSMVFGMPMALFPAFAQHQFHGGTATAGLLYAAPAFGGILGGAFSGPLSLISRQGLAIVIASVFWGLGIVAFGLTHTLWVGVIALAVAGMADMVNGVFRTTMLQVNTPDDLLGRVNSVGFVTGEVGPSLGNVEAGAVAAAFSPALSAVSGGILCVLGAGLVALARPGFVRYRAMTTAPQHR